MKMERCE